MSSPTEAQVTEKIDAFFVAYEANKCMCRVCCSLLVDRITRLKYDWVDIVASRPGGLPTWEEECAHVQGLVDACGTCMCAQKAAEKQAEKLANYYSTYSIY